MLSIDEFAATAVVVISVEYIFSGNNGKKFSQYNAIEILKWEKEEEKKYLNKPLKNGEKEKSHGSEAGEMNWENFQQKILNPICKQQTYLFTSFHKISRQSIVSWK